MTDAEGVPVPTHSGAVRRQSSMGAGGGTHGSLENGGQLLPPTTVHAPWHHWQMALAEHA